LILRFIAIIIPQKKASKCWQEKSGTP